MSPMLLYSVLPLACLAFNVDTRFPVVFSGSPDSYFGFSVAFVRSKDGPQVLVTATRANSTLLRVRLHQPGVLYRCSIRDASCDEVVLDSKGNVVVNRGADLSYKDKQDDMWLGVSLDVQQDGPQRVVTCGHLWKNQYYSQHYLANGVCYVTNSDLERRSTRKLLPFIEKGKQSIIPPGIYYYAFGQFGFSAHFSADGKTLLVGAPGFYDWIGTVVSYDTDQLDAMPPVVPIPPGEQSPSTESYVGYSVTSGRFFNGREVYTAVGAPRGANNKGAVYVFRTVQESGRRITVEQRKEGQQLGEYFGAAVLAADFNDDKLADLIVGAPFHCQPSGGDEGKVYVFISDGMGLQEQKELVGLQKTSARFGNTLANLGDINQDSYNDLAVGAPYEDARGAVYIYHGTESGITPQYSQRIAASDVDDGLSGFGISIARGADIDYNSYPDLLVGAYSSDRAILFRTRPVVQVWSRVTFDPLQINANSSKCRVNDRTLPCVNVTSCLRYTGRHLSGLIDFRLTLQIDTSRQKDRPVRGYILHDGQGAVQISRKEELEAGVESCFVNRAIITADKQDVISPISFTLTSALDSDVPRNDSFCKRCPVLDKHTPEFVTSELAFQNGCGNDNVCTSDLKLDAFVSELRRNQSLVVGQNTSLTLHVTLANTQEPAYVAEVRIILPQEVDIVNQAGCQREEMTLLCLAGNPLQTGQPATFVIKLHAGRLTSSTTHLVIRLEATTVSRELTPEDDSRNITIPFTAVADIGIRGLADMEQILYGGEGATQDSVQYSHTYVVANSRPSPIRSVLVFILIPTSFRDAAGNFANLTKIEVNSVKGSSVPGSCNVTLADKSDVGLDYDKKRELSLDISDSLARKRRSAEPSREVTRITWLNCSTVTCETIMCFAGPFLSNVFATFRVTVAVDMRVLNTALRKWDQIAIVSEGRTMIQEDNQDLQPEGHRPDNTMVTVTLVRAGPPLPRSVATWIIAVSVGAGLLLLLLIMLVLIRMGFFRRQQYEQMKMMMQQASFKEWEPYLLSDDQLHKAKEAYNISN